MSGNLMHHKREQYCFLNNMTHFFILQVMKNLMNYVLTLVLNWMKWYSLADSCFIHIQFHKNSIKNVRKTWGVDKLNTYLGLVADKCWSNYTSLTHSFLVDDFLLYILN